MILTLSDREEHIFNKVVAALNDESVLEVTYGSHLSVLTFPGLEIHIKEQTVYHNDTLIPLTHREFFTLTYLASHPFWVFSKEQIYEEDRGWVYRDCGWQRVSVCGVRIEAGAA